MQLGDELIKYLIRSLMKFVHNRNNVSEFVASAMQASGVVLDELKRVKRRG